MKQKTQKFNDGVVNIYKVDNTSQAGNKPKEGLTLKVGPLRYEERTVGMSRYWTAMQDEVQIDYMIRVPKIKTISSQDIAIIDDKQYKITQVQYINDVNPPSIDLSLERLEANYVIG